MKKFLIIILFQSLSLCAANAYFYCHNATLNISNFNCCSETKGTNSQALCSCCSDAIGNNTDVSCSCCSFAEGEESNAICSCCSVAEGYKSQAHLSVCNNSFGTESSSCLGCFSRATGKHTAANCGFCNFSTSEYAISYCGCLNHSDGKSSCTCGFFNYVVDRSQAFCCFNCGLVPNAEIGLSCCSVVTDSSIYDPMPPLCCPCPKIVNENGVKPICCPSKSDCRTMFPSKKTNESVGESGRCCGFVKEKSKTQVVSKPKNKKSFLCCKKKDGAKPQRETDQGKESNYEEAPENQLMKEVEI